MSEELWSSLQVIEHLKINLNNLRQLQSRKTINWKKKIGKQVFYDAAEIRAYQIKRESRKQE